MSVRFQGSFFIIYMFVWLLYMYILVVCILQLDGIKDVQLSILSVHAGSLCYL